MVSYPHFAIPNLFLKNGYLQEESEYGELLSYTHEDALEACIRVILAIIPKRLNGPHLRFLRRGLDLSQEAFGQFVDRDAQTIARLEKSNAPISQTVDLAIRSRFLARFKPCMTNSEMLSIHDCKARFPTEKILLSYQDGKWSYCFDIPKLKIFFTNSQTSETESLINEVSSDGVIYQRHLSIPTIEDVFAVELDSQNDTNIFLDFSYNKKIYEKTE